MVKEQWEIALPLDSTILVKSKVCLKAKFPVCLDLTLRKMFGQDYRHVLGSVTKGKFAEMPVTRPTDVWDLYEKYVASLEQVLGNDVGRIIRSSCLNQIDSMCGTKCPLYVVEFEKLEKL